MAFSSIDMYSENDKPCSRGLDQAKFYMPGYKTLYTIASDNLSLLWGLMKVCHPLILKVFALTSVCFDQI